MAPLDAAYDDDLAPLVATEAAARSALSAPDGTEVQVKNDAGLTAADEDVESGAGMMANFGDGKGSLRPALVWAELWPLVRLGGPVVIGYLLQTSLNLIAVFAIGHSGDATELAAIALGNMFAIVSGLSPGLGLATAADTLSSQAYGRDPKSPLVGIILQQSILILMLLAIPVSVLWLTCEQILLLFQQDPAIAHMAGQYCKWLIPGLPAVYTFEALKKYTQAQGLTYVTMLALCVGACVNALSAYLLIYVFGFGFIGAPISLVVCWYSLCLFTWGFVWGRGLHRDTWYGWSRAAFRGWKQYIKLGVPGMIMLMNEWCAFEGVAIAAGLIGEIELAAQTVVMTTASFVFMLPLGVAVATSISVGNRLGAGDPWGVVIASAHGPWGYLFTDDEQVVHVAGQLLLIYSLFAIVDGAVAVSSGVLRGAGHQKTGAIVNFISFYIVGLPIGFVLCFVLDQSIYGLWWGLCLGSSLCAGIFLVIVYRYDWLAEVKQAQERITTEAEEAAEAEDGRGVRGLFRRLSSRMLLLSTASSPNGLDEMGLTADQDDAADTSHTGPSADRRALIPMATFAAQEAPDLDEPTSPELIR